MIYLIWVHLFLAIFFFLPFLLIKFDLKPILDLKFAGRQKYSLIYYQVELIQVKLILKFFLLLHFVSLILFFAKVEVWIYMISLSSLTPFFLNSQQ